MKIRKLTIRNYKVFDEVEFDFTDRDGKTLDTIVLAGVNGCGKTTVLEVIEGVLNRMMVFFELEQNQEIQVEIEFDEIEKTKVLSDFPEGSKFSDDPVILNAKTWYVHAGQNGIRSHEFLDHLFAICPSVYLPVKNGETHEYRVVRRVHLDIGKNLMKQNLLNTLTDEVFKNRNHPPEALIKSQISKVDSTLSEMELNSRLVDFEAKELVFKSANGQRIHFEQLSNGEQQLYFRATYLNQLNIENALLLVDEPEDSLHPTWQQKIAKLYQQVGTNNQVFMATHSPHIMASVPPESLFVLHVEEGEAGKKKIRVINMGKAGKHSLGVEPNRILKEIMQVQTLRDFETQVKIDRLAELLTLDDFESDEAEQLAEDLTIQLGRQDSFIVRLEHQLLMLRRKKAALEPALVA